MDHADWASRRLEELAPFGNQRVEAQRELERIAEELKPIAESASLDPFRLVEMDIAERQDNVYNRNGYTQDDSALRTYTSGALSPDSKRADDHAKQYYESVRHMQTDAKRIAANTDFTEKEIQEIKQFVFLEEHDLGDLGIRRFDPSFEMAQSWQRLIDGKNIQPHDLTLLLHERMERQLMLSGMTQGEAHRAASEQYNYAKEARAYYGETN